MLRNPRPKTGSQQDERALPGREKKNLQDTRQAEKTVVGKRRRHSSSRAMGAERRRKRRYNTQVHKSTS